MKTKIQLAIEMKDKNLFRMFHTIPELLDISKSTIGSLSDTERERLAEIKLAKNARALTKLCKKKQK